MFDNMIKVLVNYWPSFLSGILVTLELAAITVICGAILGSLICLMKISSKKILRGISIAYIEIIRGTPLLVQLYLFYFLLPMVTGIDFSKFTSVALGLVINSSAYVAEIIRAGIQAVDKGQTEASRSLGISGKNTMIKIVLPQAIKNILPSLGNEFIMVIKETSLASVFFVGDIMTVRATITGALYLAIEPLIIVSVIYFILTFSLSKVVGVFERRMSAGD